MRLFTSLPFLGFVSSLACTPPKPLPEVNEPKAESKEVELEVSKATPLPEPSVDKPLSPPPEPAPSVEPILKFTGAFATPESVLYDPAADRYLVSNVNGAAGAMDGNGYILELSPDGRVTNPKLIAGGMNKVRLDAPKGLAIVGSELWVADITLVRKFDLKTLAPKGDIALPDATFANDIAVAADGKVYVSDSSAKVGEKGFEFTGGDQVLVIDKSGKAKALAKSKDLGGPNGLAFGPKGLLVNTLNSNEVFGIGPKGEKVDIIKMPNGGLDGLLVVGDTLICSSWGASVVYRGKLGGTSYEPIIQNVKGPADIGWDSKRSRVLIPRFLDDVVEAFDVK